MGGMAADQALGFIAAGGALLWLFNGKSTSRHHLRKVRRHTRKRKATHDGH